MTQPSRAWLGALALLAACARDAGASPPPAGASCMPAGLAHTHVVAAVVLPAGCTFVQGGSTAAPQRIDDAAALAAHVRCDGAPPAIDLATQDLYVVTETMSPAFGGNEVRDDGTTITFVTRFRSPCPNDPRPMPMQRSFGFVLPRHATRRFRDANCTLPPRC